MSMFCMSRTFLRHSRTLFQSNNNPKGEKYLTAVTEAVVSYAINLLPLCDLERIKLLSRTFVLAFLHDDAVDAGNISDDVVLIPTEKNSKPSHKAFNIISEEILAADPVNGAILIDDILSWGSTSRNHQQGPTCFSSLDEYITHGLEDFGATLILRCVEFSIADSRSSSPMDLQSISYLKSLCAKHLLLTNDLYSYAKEVASGDTGLNAVRVVQDLMGCSDSSAKMMVRLMLRDVERQMDEEYTRLDTTSSTNSVNDAQLKHARAMIIAVAGNMYFSATCDRYARAVEGSRLV
ncbi:terpene cyclase [Aspergillus tubingensis]|nr:terpene cyclase [Aspergillus tubingensis]